MVRLRDPGPFIKSIHNTYLQETYNQASSLYFSLKQHNVFSPYSSRGRINRWLQSTLRATEKGSSKKCIETGQPLRFITQSNTAKR